MKQKTDKLIRTINLKLCPTSEQIPLLNKFITDYGIAHDMAVNEIFDTGRTNVMGIDGAKSSFLYPEEKTALKNKISEFAYPSNRTQIEAAIGMKTATAYMKERYKRIKSDIKNKENKIKKLLNDKVNTDIFFTRGIYFNKEKVAKEGTCSICKQKIITHYWTNEKEYIKECACKPCFDDLCKYRNELKNIKRKSIKNIKIYEAYEASENVSDLFKRIMADVRDYRNYIINKYGSPINYFSHTSSNKTLNWHNKHVIKSIDFDTQLVSARLDKNITIQIPFTGENYYTNYPKYGYESKSNTFKKLIHDHINKRAGNSFFIRSVSEKYGTSFYLSVPTNYPISKDIYPTGGCIITSSKYVLIYTHQKIIFINLYNHYIKKRMFKKEQSKHGKKIKKWKRAMKIAKKNNEPFSTPIPLLPEKFRNNHLNKYIRFQNHIVSRNVIETVKSHFPLTSFLLMDYTWAMLNDIETVVPITTLNEQIKHKLQYDGMYAESVNHKKLRESMECPKCLYQIPERVTTDGTDRLLVRDIILSIIHENYKCGECGYTINPLILIAKNAMRYSNV